MLVLKKDVLYFVDKFDFYIGIFPLISALQQFFLPRYANPASHAPC